MTTLEQHAADYLRIRRALGFKLERAEKLLAQYLAFLKTTGQDRVTIENTLAWTRLPPGASSSWWAFRLSTVRCFVTYLHALDQPTRSRPRTSSPAGSDERSPTSIASRRSGR